MKNGQFRIIDADGHVMEPAGMWARYIDPAFRDRAPRIERDREGHSRIVTGDRLSPRYECVSTVEAMLAMPIPDRAKKKILWDNPAALYGLRA
jgi:hypothetical protein